MRGALEVAWRKFFRTAWLAATLMLSAAACVDEAPRPEMLTRQFALTIPAGNLTTNPSVETNLTGWQTYQSSLTRTTLANAPHGTSVIRVARSTGTGYSVEHSGAVVTSATAGKKYRGRAYVAAANAATVGRTILVALREVTAGGTQVRVTESPQVPLTDVSGGFTLLETNATVQNSGNNLEFYVFVGTSAAGDAFYADLLTVEEVGTASQLVFTTPSRSFTAGSCGGAGNVITVQLQDSTGTAVNAPAGGRAFTASSTGTETWYTDASCTAVATGGTFTIPSGSSSVNLYYRDTLAGSPQVTLSNASSLANPAAQTHTVSPGMSNKLGFTVQPSNAAAGAAIAPALQVSVRDAYDNLVSSSSASISLALAANPGSATLAGTLTATAAGGVATFSNVSLNRTGNGYTLTATSTGVTAATSNAFNIVPGAASRLTFGVGPSNAQAGQSLSPAVQVRVEDAQGNVVTGSNATVTLSLSTNPGSSTLSGTTAVAAASGIATFSNLSLNRVSTGYRLGATATGLTGATSVTFNITPGAASRVLITAEPTNVLAGSPISPAVQATIQDAQGNTVTGSSATVTISIGNNAGGATLSGTTSAAASAGVASFSTLSLNAAGSGYTLVAASTGLTSDTSAGFDVLPASASRLAFSIQPSNAGAGTSINPAVRVEVQDNLGNLVSSSTAPITVGLSANPGGATLSGTLTVNASGGVATFSNLSLDRTGTGYRLSASSAGFVGAVSGTFNITAGAATALAFTVQPSDEVAGQALTPAVQVTVRDTLGNVVTGSTASISLALGNNPGGATLSGTSTVSAVSGAASFSTLSLNRPGNGYTLVATATGLTSSTSAPFSISVGSASVLAFTVPPSDGLAGSPLSPAVQVEVRDSAGNVVSSSAPIALQLSTNPAGAVLGGTLTVNAVNGTASFADLSLDRAATGFRLTATSAGMSSAVSPTFNVSGGAASKLVFTTPSRTVVAGACSQAVTVAAQDAIGNSATLSAALPVAIALNGAQLFSDATCVTALGTPMLNPGTPQISVYFRGTDAASLMMDTSAAGLSDASQAQTITPGAVTTLQVGGVPTPSVAGATAQATVTARDAFGNRVTTFTGAVALSSTDVRAQLPSGSSMSSADQGQVVLPVVLRTLGLQSLTATSGALTGTQAGIDVVAGPVHHLSLTGLPSSTFIERSLNVTLEARDQYENPVASYAGTVVFSSTDAFAALPSPVQFTPAMQGSITQPMRFRTAGTHDVVATDAANPLLFGAQTGVVVDGSSPPLIIKNANLKGAVGLAYRYNAAGRVEADGARPLTFESCGGPAGFLVDAQTGTVTWVPDAAGPVGLCVRASNSVNPADTYSFTVNVASRTATPVTADFTATPASGMAPLDVSLDASASTADPTALPLMFQWSFGDGSPFEQGATPRHRFALPGGYRVRLTAYDAYGAQGEKVADVKVLGPGGANPPSAAIQVSGNAAANPFLAELSCNCVAGDAPIQSYRWELGLGGAPESGAMAHATYPAGAYTVRLTVVDANGLSATDSVLITVNRDQLTPPRCSASAAQPVGDTPFSTVWQGQAAAGSAPVVRQEWTIDGQVIAGATAARTYAQPGTYHGSFVAEDANGLTCRSELDVVATVGGQAPPRILSAPSAAGHCGLPYLYAAQATGTPALQWSLSGAPEGMSVDASTGLLQWVPSASSAGRSDVTLVVSNGAGTDRQTFAVDIDCQGKLNLAVGCGCGSGVDVLGLPLAVVVLLWHARRRSRIG